MNYETTVSDNSATNSPSKRSDTGLIDEVWSLLGFPPAKEPLQCIHRTADNPEYQKPDQRDYGYPRESNEKSRYQPSSEDASLEVLRPYYLNSISTDSYHGVGPEAIVEKLPEIATRLATEGASELAILDLGNGWNPEGRPMQLNEKDQSVFDKIEAQGFTAAIICQDIPGYGRRDDYYRYGTGDTKYTLVAQWNNQHHPEQQELASDGSKEQNLLKENAHYLTLLASNAASRGENSVTLGEIGTNTRFEGPPELTPDQQKVKDEIQARGYRVKWLESPADPDPLKSTWYMTATWDKANPPAEVAKILKKQAEPRTRYDGFDVPTRGSDRRRQQTWFVPDRP